ncbi:hypothetical protein EI94DRAFT_1790111 [Lactarius quietus]|nr:hypothetical protein EI94DRAFT_1790111 [Lactarius quietus]
MAGCPLVGWDCPVGRWNVARYTVIHDFPFLATHVGFRTCLACLWSRVKTPNRFISHAIDAIQGYDLSRSQVAGAHVGFRSIVLDHVLDIPYLWHIHQHIGVPLQVIAVQCLQYYSTYLNVHGIRSRIAGSPLVEDGRIMIIIGSDHTPNSDSSLGSSMAFIATAPTLNFNVTQRSLALGMLGVPQSHDCRVNFGMARAPSTPVFFSLIIHILHRLISHSPVVV